MLRRQKASPHRVAFVVTDGDHAEHLETELGAANVQWAVVLPAANPGSLAASAAKHVVFMRTSTQVPSGLLDALSGRLRKAALVPGAPAAIDDADLLAKAVTTAGTALPRKAALAALAGGPTEHPSVLRARAIASHRIAVRRLAGPRAIDTLEAEPPRDVIAAAADEFVALATVNDGSPAVRAALDVVRKDLAGLVGRVLRANPGLRADALASLADARRLGFDMQEVNAQSARTLAIAYAFPPFLDTSGFVTARRFALTGEPYDVVTQDMTGHRPIDERSLGLAEGELGSKMLVSGRAAFGSWVTIEKFCRKGMARIEDAEAEKGPYEALYSRSMWAASTVLGAWYKARHPDVPWTAELSDPLVQRPNGERRQNPFPDNDILQEIDAAARRLGRPGWAGEGFFEAVEWMAYALADEVIFTNENQREFMLGDFYDAELARRARAISTVSHHPVPPNPMYEVAAPADGLPTGFITVAYFGRFYAVRGVSDLLDPFAELSEAERARLRFMIFTTEVEETRQAVAKHPAAQCVEVRDALPYFEFLATARAVDWLIVADAHRPPEFPLNPFLPSKLADYLGTGTPIWALAEPGSVLSREPVAAVSPLGDVHAAAEVIRSHILAG